MCSQDAGRDGGGMVDYTGSRRGAKGGRGGGGGERRVGRVKSEDWTTSFMKIEVFSGA